MTEISIVIPVFQNKESIMPLTSRLVEVLGTIDIDDNYELIFVNDGSTDGSNEVLMQLSEMFDCAIKIVRLSRNFGQVAAISAGLAQATGKAVVIMSADLQDPPELIPKMYREWATGKDIVIAHRTSRQDSFRTRLTSRLAYRIARNKYPSIPRGGFDFLLLSSRANKAYLAMKGKNRFFQGDIMYLGFAVGFVAYSRAQRVIGRSQWTFWKRFKYFQDMIVASSNIIPKTATLVGGFMSTIGLVTATITVTLPITNLGHSSLQLPLFGAAVASLLLGLIIFLLGQIGEYLWRIHEELIDRPTYLVDQITETKSNHSSRISDDRLP